jgi:peptide/nickel transport system substrate-binding protein
VRLRSLSKNLATVALAAVLVLTACGTDDSSDGATVDSITIGLPTAITSLDPAYVGSVKADLSVVSSVYSALTQVGPDNQLRPDAAQKWEQVEPTKWVFTLRDDVTFSDGTKLTAASVKWNLDRLRDPANALKGISYVRDIVDVRAPDATTVEVITRGPNSETPRILSFIYLLDPTWAESHNPTVEALGSGPYQIESYNAQGDTVLVRNPHFYGEPAQIGRVTFRVFSSDSSRVAALRAGELDLASALPLAELDSARSIDGVIISSNETARIDSVTLNTDVKPFEDVRVRRALNYAVDKEKIASTVLRGLTTPVPGQWFSSAFASAVNQNLSAYPYDPAKARALLAEAGYPDGFSVDWEFSSNGGTDDQVVQAIAQQLAEVGVKATLKPITASEWNKKYAVEHSISGLTYTKQGSQYTSPIQFLGFYRSDVVFNYWYNKEYDALVEQISHSTDDAQRKALFDQATQLAHDDAAVIFLWPEPNVYALRSNLEWTPRVDDFVRPYDVSVKAAG